MSRLLLILLITSVSYTQQALAQTNPGAARNTQATTAAPPAPPSSVTPPPEVKDENCWCEAQVLPEVLATVNGVRITSRDVNTTVGERVSALQRQVVEARKRELDLQINSRLLEAEAKKRKVTTVKLLEDEIVAKVKDPTDAEVQAFYDQNKARIGAELKDARSDIIVYLRNQHERDEAQKFAERLRAAAAVKVLAPASAPPASAAERARVLATVNGEQITAEDVENALRPLVFNVQEQVYNLRQQEVNLKINDALLEQEAQKRKVTTNALLDAEVTAKVKPVTEADARAFYDQNKERLNGGYEQLKPQLLQFLQERETRNAQLAFADQLRSAAAIQTFLTAPAPPVYNIATDDQPARGVATAPVTVIEFTDYQCPSCAAAQPIVDGVLKEYEGRVRLVVRDFPLEMHADAFKAAEAAEAAREQGKYWEYVALMMRNQSALSVPKLKEYAGQLSLDRAKFDAALDSGRFSDKVQRDMRDGMRLGVTGTPTLFVNGRRVAENTPESLKAAIETALKETAKK